MRGVFGLVGLLVALGVVGFVVKKQLASVNAPVPALQLPASATGLPVPAPGANAAEQSRQVQEQFRQALDSAVQQARPLPDDK